VIPRRNPERFLARLWAMEATLVAAGLPPMPAWWRETIERFERTGRRRRVLRKGRRVFASTCVAPRLAVAEMLFGEHAHLPGTPPLLFAFLSVRRDEAANRLRGVRAILDVLEVPYVERGETIELLQRPALFAVVTANFRVSVGETVAFAWCDEVARWNDDGANPADEVVGSLAPALATLANSSLWLVSSPLGPDDFHARAFARGETADQSVAFGETWAINPSLSEADTRALEPDERIWRREYAAQPQAGILAAFPPELVARAFEPREVFTPGEPVMVIDPSSGGGASADWFTWAIASWCTDEEHRYLRRPDGSYIRGPHEGKFENPNWTPRRPYFRITHVDGIAGGFFGSVSGDDIINRLVDVAQKHGVRHVHSDQRESLFLGTALEKRKLIFHAHTWTSASKPEAVAIVRRWLADGALWLPEHDHLRRELLAFEERIAPSGQLTFGARRGGHDDFTALVLTLAHAEMALELPKSPLKPPNVYGARMAPLLL